ncbi:MAG: acyl-CoA thioesterase [Gammaproteobacteria bacterium]|nr:MAG: acyl-CoA thioesterase [Gammaproteobacteria bacterium]
MMNVYEFSYPVRLDDLDYMGIVGNSNWLTFLERSRIDLLDKVGFPFSEMMKNKIGGVVAEANVKFLKPAFFGDTLKIKVSPHSPFKKGLLLQYIVENQKNELSLTAEIKIIFVDESGRATKMPDKISENFFGTSIEPIS